MSTVERPWSDVCEECGNEIPLLQLYSHQVLHRQHAVQPGCACGCDAFHALNADSA